MSVLRDLARLEDEDAKNCYEAIELLALIDAEFRTDPMSTQCFDGRVVERVRQCVEKNKILGAKLERTWS